jgi:hypothetical protein
VLGQVRLPQHQTYIGWGDELHRSAIDRAEAGAQRLVTLNDAVHGGLQCGHIQGPLQAHPTGDGIGGVCMLVELGEKPQPLLRKGQGQCLLAL